MASSLSIDSNSPKHERRRRRSGALRPPHMARLVARISTATKVLIPLMVSLCATTAFSEPVSYEHNRMKELLSQGSTVVGARLYLESPRVAHVLARSGFDFLFIDLEHLPLNPETVRAMIEAMKGADAVPIVRVPGKAQWLANVALDAGARGLVIPNVKTPEDAVSAVQSMRYPPEGVRGVGPSVAAGIWDVGVYEYVAIANRNILAAILIEHIDAVEAIDDILSVPGIDLVLVGVNDLAASMGLLGQLRNPEQEAAVQKVLDATKKHGIPAATVGTNPEDANLRIAQGFQGVLIGHDGGYLDQGARSALSEIERKGVTVPLRTYFNKVMDANGDGTISLNEHLSRQHSSLARIDADKNNALSLEEFILLEAYQGPDGKLLVPPRSEEGMQERGEYMEKALARENVVEFFGQLAGDDGLLSNDTLLRLHFEGRDLNGDGELTFEEVSY